MADGLYRLDGREGNSGRLASWVLMDWFDDHPMYGSILGDADVGAVIG